MLTPRYKTNPSLSLPNLSLLLSSLQHSVHALHCLFDCHTNTALIFESCPGSSVFIMNKAYCRCVWPSRLLANPNMPVYAHAKFLLLLLEAFVVPLMLVIVTQAHPTGNLPGTSFLMSAYGIISRMSYYYAQPVNFSLVSAMCQHCAIGSVASQW